jgi:AraC family transcriptional regulator
VRWFTPTKSSADSHQDITLKRLSFEWSGFALGRQEVPAGERSEELLARHYMVLWTGEPAFGERADRQGLLAPYAKYPGTLSLGTAGVIPAVRARTPTSGIACTLDPDYITGIERELDARPVSSLCPQLGIEDEGMRQLLQLLLAEADRGWRLGALYADSLFHALAIRFLYRAREETPLKTVQPNGLPQPCLRRVLDRMHSEFDTGLGLAALAAESGYSRAHFLRMFRAATGKTPHQMLLEVRIAHARERLETTADSVLDIALACGFSSHSHLTTVFRQLVGVTPSQYRRMK